MKEAFENKENNYNTFQECNDLENENENANAEKINNTKDSPTSLLKESEFTIYDSILNEYGYGKEIWKIIIAILLMYLAGSYAHTVFSTMTIPYQEYLKLTDNEMSHIGMIFFIYKAIGSLFAGYITTLFSRTSIINFSYIILIFLTFMTGLIHDYSFLLVTRIIFGLISGFFNVVSNNILVEYLPIHFRSFYLNSVWAGFSLSQIVNNLIMLFTMPQMQVEGIGATNFVYSGVLLISFILSLILLRDSPRNLILNQKEEAAFEIMYTLKDREFFTNEVKMKILKEVREGVNKEEEQSSHVFEVFNKTYLLFTFCVVFINLGMNVFVDGGNFIVNFVLKATNIENEKAPVGDIVKSNITLNTANLLSNFLYAYLTEVEFLGRKKTILLGLVMLTASIFPIILFPGNITLFLTIFSFLTNVSIVVNSYASEVYPTRIRDIGIGWVFGIGYLGSAVSQYIVLTLFSINWRAPYIFMMIVSIFCSIVICFSPVETYERPLDIKLNEKKEDSNTKEEK